MLAKHAHTLPSRKKILKTILEWMHESITSSVITIVPCTGPDFTAHHSPQTQNPFSQSQPDKSRLCLLLQTGGTSPMALKFQDNVAQQDPIESMGCGPPELHIKAYQT